MKDVSDYLKGKRILITGISGSLGNKLIEKMYGYCGFIRGLSRNESKQIDLRIKYPDLELRSGDVSDYHTCLMATKEIDIVFHCAAFKFLDRGEIQPSEVVKTNIIGCRNIVNASVVNNVDTTVGISTDKVCHPENIYGMSKAILEYLFKEANEYSDTRFVIVRYGNVLNSTGSVVPFWMKLGKSGKDLPVTCYDMTRFYWTVDTAVDFVLNSLLFAKGGEVYIKKMKSLDLKDLVEVMSSHYGVSHYNAGLRLGEKLNEEIISKKELNRSIETDELFIIPVHSEYKEKYDSGYTSDIAERYTQDEIKDMLDKEGWL